MGLPLRAPTHESAPSSAPGVRPGDDEPGAVTLPLARAADAGVALVGAKAANLGRASAAGLSVLPGFVIPTDAVVALGH